MLYLPVSMRLFRFILVCVLMVALPARSLCVVGVGCHDETHSATAHSSDTHHAMLDDFMHLIEHAVQDLGGYEPSAELDAAQVERICASQCAAPALHRVPARTNESMLLARLAPPDKLSSFDDAQLAHPKRPPRSI